MQMLFQPKRSKVFMTMYQLVKTLADILASCLDLSLIILQCWGKTLTFMRISTCHARSKNPVTLFHPCRVDNWMVMLLLQVSCGSCASGCRVCVAIQTTEKDVLFQGFKSSVLTCFLAQAVSWPRPCSSLFCSLTHSMSSAVSWILNPWEQSHPASSF